jgi:hypothetical protein
MESVLAEKLLGGDRSHVGGLESPLALVDVELDLLALLQRAIPAGLDGAEVHEDVLARLGADEAIPFSALNHFTVPTAMNAVLPHQLGDLSATPTPVASAARDKSTTGCEAKT